VLSRAGIAFGIVGTDTGPYERTLKIKNVGKGTLTGGVDLSGLSVPFTATGGGVFSLPHAREVLIVVTFNSTPNLGRYAGTIAISSSDPNAQIVDVPVTGRAYAGRLTLPKSLKFGTVAVGKTKNTTLTIKNTGYGVLHGSVDASSLDGSNFSVLAGGGAFVLSENQQQKVVLQFAPSGSGPFTASLTVTADSPGRSSETVNLTGKGK
jgi:HYDIN/CFA65/VesB family protein